MKGVTKTLMGIQTGGSFIFRNLSRAEMTVLSSTVSKLNGDFEARRVDGEDTTLTIERKTDEIHRCYHAIVTRFPGVLPKEGGRFVKPRNPLLAD